jgi:hypothetical protein
MRMVNPILAAVWLAAGIAFFVLFWDRSNLWMFAWAALLLSLFNLVKWWAQSQARRRRDEACSARKRPYHEGEPPPVRHAP